MMGAARLTHLLIAHLMDASITSAPPKLCSEMFPAGAVTSAFPAAQEGQ